MQDTDVLHISAHGAVPVVQDGQDRDMIEAVERDCKYVTTIRCISAKG